jgi:hypothetical protein
MVASHVDTVRSHPRLQGRGSTRRTWTVPHRTASGGTTTCTTPVKWRARWLNGEPVRRLFNCACTRSSWRLTERYFQFWRSPSAAAPALYPEARGMDRPPTDLHCPSWLGRGVRPEPAPKGPRSLSVSLREGSVSFGRLTRAESKAAAKILADWHERLVQVSPLACHLCPPSDRSPQCPRSRLRP